MRVNRAFLALSRVFCRANDAMLVLIVGYALVLSLVCGLSDTAVLMIHFVHATAWCAFHYIGLGILLRAQSENKYLVRHFMKNYHYPHNDGGTGAIIEAFSNWKAIYNLSLCMTYGWLYFCSPQRDLLTGIASAVSCIGVVWKTYSIPNDWTVGDELLRHTLGAVRISISFPIPYGLRPFPRP